MGHRDAWWYQLFGPEALGCFVFNSNLFNSIQIELRLVIFAQVFCIGGCACAAPLPCCYWQFVPSYCFPPVTGVRSNASSLGTCILSLRTKHIWIMNPSWFPCSPSGSSSSVATQVTPLVIVFILSSFPTT